MAQIKDGYYVHKVHPSNLVGKHPEDIDPGSLSYIGGVMVFEHKDEAIRFARSQLTKQGLREIQFSERLWMVWSPGVLSHSAMVVGRLFEYTWSDDG